MMSTYFNATILRPLRALVIAFACALLLFVNAVPAVAAGTTSPSKPSEGETQLKKIYDESEKSLNSGLDSIEEVSKRAERGTNEVQGGADLDKMSTPENSQEATTFKDQVKKALDKVTPGS
ncbi:MAG: hypothetical protein NW224_11170 [Leptolyngbyaceae cyanobacterium bins.302]|nr:hypothetical protein [Leptolyngbyaceae cyanobacterium bins.302]